MKRILFALALLVPTHAFAFDFPIADTGTVNLGSNAAGELTADVIVSPDAGNTATATPNGVYVPDTNTDNQQLTLDEDGVLTLEGGGDPIDLSVFQSDPNLDNDPANELGTLTITGDVVTYDPDGPGPAPGQTITVVSGVSADANNDLTVGTDGLPYFDHIPSACLPEFMVTADNTDTVSGFFPCVSATYAVVSGTETNVTSVVINPDGSHTVELDPQSCIDGTWSYDYTQTDPEGNVNTTTVSGVVDNSIVPLLTVQTNAAAGQDHNLGLVLATGDTYDVDWGDGTVSAGVPSATTATASSHNYPSGYTGDVVVSARACDTITQIRSTQNAWTTDIVSISGQTPDVNFLQWTGNNTGTGDISAAAANWPNMTNFVWLGQNTGFGDLVAAAPFWPDMVRFEWGGNNTGTGNIAAAAPFWADLERFVWNGNNTGSGDLTAASVHWPNLTQFVWNGLNTGFGDIGLIAPNWPNLTQFEWAGMNTGMGDITVAAPNWPNLTWFEWAGMNTGTGDVAVAAPSWPNLNRFDWIGLNTSVWSSVTWPWASPFTRMRWFSQVSTQAHVDNALASSAMSPAWSGLQTVNVGGPNPAPSAAGLAFCATILANGAVLCATN